jgi:hypothetical protein
MPNFLGKPFRGGDGERFSKTLSRLILVILFPNRIKLYLIDRFLMNANKLIMILA